MTGRTAAYSWIRDTEFADLGRSSLWRGAVFKAVEKGVGEGSFDGYFMCTLSILALQPGRKVCYFPEHSQGRLCHFPKGFRLWSSWHGCYQCQKQTFTQEFTYSGFPPLPTPNVTGLYSTDVTNVFKSIYQGICPSLVRAILYISFNYTLPVNPSVPMAY